MARLIQWNMVSLDGYFEGALSWESDWFQPLFNDELERFSIEQLRRADALLFGRTTYQAMASYWSTASGEVAEYINSLPKIVFSSTLESVHWRRARLVSGHIGPEVARLRKEDSGDLYVLGSGKLCATLYEADLFDEIHLCVMPIVLSHGATQVGHSIDRIRMRLMDAKTLSNGCVILRYEPQHRK